MHLYVEITDASVNDNYSAIWARSKKSLSFVRLFGSDRSSRNPNSFKRLVQVCLELSIFVRQTDPKILRLDIFMLMLTESRCAGTNVK